MDAQHDVGGNSGERNRSPERRVGRDGTPKVSRKVRTDAQLAWHDAALSTEQAAGLLQVSAAWIRRLTNEGVFSKVDGRYRLVDTVQSYLRYQRDQQRQTGKAAATNRVLEARAKDIELRTRLREKSLIELDDALGTVDEIIGVVLTALSEMPTRTRDLAARRIISQAVYETRQRIADKANAKAKELSA
jgi:hypothetical protein